MPLRLNIIFITILLLLPFLIFSQSGKTKVLKIEGNWFERTPLHNQQVYDILQDSKGVMWFATERGLIKFDGASFRIYQNDPNELNGFGVIYISQLEEDHQGNIWIRAADGISIFDPIKEQFTNYGKIPMDQGFHNYLDVTALGMDSKGTVWLATNRGRICRYNASEENFSCVAINGFIRDIGVENDSTIWIASEPKSLIRFNPNTNTHVKTTLYDENGEQILDKVRNTLISSKGEMWLYTQGNQLYKRDTATSNKKQGLHFHGIKAADGFGINDLKEFRNGDIWAVGDRGILVLDGKDGEAYSISFEGPNKQITYDNFSILEDERSRIWIGHRKGLIKLKLEKETPFVKYDNFPSLMENIAWQYRAVYFGELDAKRILIGTDAGLFAFNLEEKQIRPISYYFPELALFDHLRIQHIFKDSQSGIWISAKDPVNDEPTLWRYDLKSKKITEDIVECGLVLVIAEANDETFWLGTWGGLLHFDLQRNYVKKYSNNLNDINSISGNFIQSLTIENDSLLWIGTGWGGLNRLNTNTEEFTRFQFDPRNRNSLISNRVTDTHIDSKGFLWVATDGGGLCRMDTRREGFERFLKDQGLNTLHIAAIEEDNDQQIWVNTKDGISKYNRDSGVFQNYDSTDGIPIESLSYDAHIKDSEGYLYFANSHSFTRFHPQNVKRDTVVPKMIFSEFYLNNKLVLPHQENSPIEKSISLTNAITLKHNQNFIGFKFAALNFTEPEKNHYAYRMVGLFNDWQFIDNKHEVTFANLDVGDYILQVKGSNHLGIWNEEGISLKITILPPWYHTWWAYILWSILIISSVFAFYRFQLNRRLAEAEALRLKELDEAKSILYTNITHEFRTPLTIILGMSDQIKSDPQKWFNEGLRLIRRNGIQLLSLVNQLLDLSKLESGNMSLKLLNGDIVSFLQYLTESMHSYGDSKDIRLHFSSDFKELKMDYDSEKLQKVVSNLLSNAVKFTPAGGDVYLDFRRAVTREKAVLLQVRDNGVGIAAKHLPFIFDRFYQVDSTTTRRGEGSGIGLSLTQQLVKLMDGEIKAESELGKGTKFSIILPMTQIGEKEPTKKIKGDSSIIGETILLKKEPLTSTARNNDVPLVLLIEDNKDIVSYLASFLSSEYRIETAFDGNQGIEKAIEITPDLIVSDVMMPHKDGFEVCSSLKKDERTSHIPIILLTAKSDLSSKIEGLSFGADAYLAKPFNKEELLVRIEQLIELRKNLQSHYQRTENWLINSEKPQASPEDLFLKKLINIVEENLSDEHFGLPGLCRKAGLSRSQLFRKLKALTGKSTTHFIRSIRLLKGKTLLETTDLNVSEVSYRVGFNNPNYFSKRFQEEFGILPSELRKGQ